MQKTLTNSTFRIDKYEGTNAEHLYIQKQFEGFGQVMIELTRSEAKSLKGFIEEWLEKK